MLLFVRVFVMATGKKLECSISPGLPWGQPHLVQSLPPAAERMEHSRGGTWGKAWPESFDLSLIGQRRDKGNPLDKGRANGEKIQTGRIACQNVRTGVARVLGKS